MDDIHVPVLEVIVMCHSEEKLYFAFRGTHEWNRLPERRCFSKKLKIWLLTHQNCDHL